MESSFGEETHISHSGDDTYSVDEVGGLVRPTLRHILILNLDLFRENVVTDLFP